MAVTELVGQFTSERNLDQPESNTHLRVHSEAPAVIRFGDFRVDLDTGELFRNGQKIPLQEKPFQILKALIERQGQMVTREQLCRRLWTGDIYLDFERGLRTAISKLRRALDDRAEHPRLVETLPRRGYRFVAPIEAQWPAPAPGAEARGGRVKVAVLPFENLSADSTQEYFGDGMTQEIISQLGRLQSRRIAVIARTSAMQYKRTCKSMEQIGMELNVDHILEGSVRLAGSRVRINAQLIHIGDLTPLWVKSYDCRLGNLLRLQHRVAQAIIRQIKQKLTPRHRYQLTPHSA